MDLIDFELYKVFYHVSKQLSFSRAAEILFISQSAVSQNIRTLEEKLDKVLFNRSTKKVSLTRDGQLLLKYIEPAIHLIQNGQNELLDHTHIKQGRLHIGASDTICRYYLLPYLEKFHRLHPKTIIQVTNRTSIDCVSLLNSGQVDFIITNTPNDYLTESMENTIVKQFHDVFVASEEYTALLSKETSLANLTEYPILMLEPHTTTSEFIHKHLNKLGVDLKADVELGSIDLLIDMAKIGIGISFIPDYCLKTDSNLKVINTLEKLPPRHLAVITNRELVLSDTSKEFIKLLL